VAVAGTVTVILPFGGDGDGEEDSVVFECDCISSSSSMTESR